MATISKTKIANMALAHVGASATIEDLDTDTSSNAKTCKLWYDHAREQLLEAHNWGFARRRRTLALHGDDPPDQWEYRYEYPSDVCLKVRSIDNDTPDDADPVPFDIELSEDGAEKTILTDYEDAVIIFTSNVETTSLFSSHFVLCLSYLLAHYIAYKITGKKDVEDKMYQRFLGLLVAAPAMDANEQAKKPPRDADWIRGR